MFTFPFTFAGPTGPTGFKSYAWTQGGYNSTPATEIRIQKFIYATEADATNVAYLTAANRLHTSSVSKTHGYACGGVATSSDYISKHQLATETGAFITGAQLTQPWGNSAGVSSSGFGSAISG